LKKIASFLKSGLLIVVAFGLVTACSETDSQGTEVGDPTQAPVFVLRFAPFSDGSLSNFQICLSEVRFFEDPDVSVASDTVSLVPPLQIQLDPTGTSKTLPGVVDGIYLKVEAVISNQCDSESVRVENSAGTLSLSSDLSLSFVGRFSPPSESELLLELSSSMLDDLESASSNDDLEAAIEGYEGSF